MRRTTARKPSPQQLPLFDATPLPISDSILPFYVSVSVPAAKTANVADLSSAGSSSISFSPAPDASPDSAARRGRRPSSISIRRNRSKYAPVAPSLEFLCGIDGDSESDPAAGGIIQPAHGPHDADPENDDGESSSSSGYIPGYTALASLTSSAAATLEASGESLAAASGRLAGEMAGMKPPQRVKEEQRLYDRSGEYEDEDGDGLRLMLTPEQLARIEEVQASWTKRQAKKRKVVEDRPLEVTEIESNGIEAGNRKRRSVDDGGDGR